jgi:hypothetical protein
VRGVAVTVGAPYYDFIAIAFGLPLVCSWESGADRLAARLARALGRSAHTGPPAWRTHRPRPLARGAGSSPPASSATPFGRLRPRGDRLEFVRGTRARHALGGGSWRSPSRASSGGTGAATAATSCTRRSCSCSSARRDRRLRHDARGKLDQGQSLQVGRYTLTYLGSEQQRAANAQELRARWRSRAAAGPRDVLAGKNRYFAEQQTSNEVAIRPTGCGQKTSSSSPTSSTPTARSSSRCCQSPRQPHLARGAPLRRRLAHHALAGRARAAAPGAALRRGGSARARLRWRSSPSARRLPRRRAVAFVARPFLAEPEARTTASRLDPAEQERLQLLERRDRALGALKELEFDHRTGKIADADYEELVGPLRGRPREALRRSSRARRRSVPVEKVDALPDCPHCGTRPGGEPLLPRMRAAARGRGSKLRAPARSASLGRLIPS